MLETLDGTVVAALDVETGVEELVEIAPLSLSAAAPPPRSALLAMSERDACHAQLVGVIKEERDDETEERGLAY